MPHFKIYIFSGPPKKGIPGAPGAADLETALRRLSPVEIVSKRSSFQHGATYGGYVKNF